LKVITTEDLSKNYGSVQALDKLSFDVEEGETYGFIGPNGAGKSTAINILTGQIQPSSGSAEVMGKDPVSEPVEVREEVGILPEREDPPSFMTPREYFEFIGEVRDISHLDRKVEEWAERLGFSDQLDTMNMDLSKGEKQKVMVAQAFLHEPELVFIDEPLTNLDPVIQEEVKDFFREYREDGNTLFICTHVLGLAEDVCTRVAIIKDGKLDKELEMEEVDDLTQEFLDEVDVVESAKKNA
jgi:ABC-2 type transport system ATP-binding protein